MKKNNYMEIGKVRDVFFGIEDHGILTLNIDFDYGGSCQGTGHLCLSNFDKSKDRIVGNGTEEPSIK